MAFDVASAEQIGTKSDGVSLLGGVPGDVGNSQRFLLCHGSDLRYCHEFKKWLHWDGRRWFRDDREGTEALGKKAVLKHLEQAVAARDAEAEKLAKASLAAPRINGMLALARCEVPVAASKLDRHPDLLVFTNGTLNLRTGEMGGFKRENHITKMVHYAYDSMAECPLFLSVLTRLMGGDTDPARAARMIDALQIYFGYALTGHTSARAVFLLLGPSGTGKTTILELFCKLLAEHATLIRIETLMEGPAQRNLGLRADLADLHGARFVRTSETEEGKRLAEAQLKAITQGQGSIRAERKFENPFEFEETHKLFIDANHRPVIRGTDSAIWDRLFIIPFDVQVPHEERDPRLPEKLLAEAEGILAWAVVGARRWYDGGRRLPQPEEFRAASESYREDMDSVGRFLEACCEFGPAFTVGSTDLYAAYRRWSEKAGEHPMSQKSFSNRMKNRDGISDGHTRKGNVFSGVRIVDSNAVGEGSES